jgi:hypothetical protein
MSYRRSEQVPTFLRKKFVPDLSALENRLLLASHQITFPDGVSFDFPIFRVLPRTGGATVQSGTLLTLGVGQRTTNTAHVNFAGAGAGTVEWNGRSPHAFTSTQAILVQAGRARHDRVTFQLDTSPSLVVSSHKSTAADSVSTITHPVHDLGAPRTSGTAVQSGTLLTITITGRAINTVEISSVNSGQVVQAEWTGGAVRDFAGVSQIVVNIRNGVRDLVALDTM